MMHTKLYAESKFCGEIVKQQILANLIRKLSTQTVASRRHYNKCWLFVSFFGGLCSFGGANATIGSTCCCLGRPNPRVTDTSCCLLANDILWQTSFISHQEIYFSENLCKFLLGFRPPHIFVRLGRSLGEFEH